jgi:hypothetical protein
MTRRPEQAAAMEGYARDTPIGRNAQPMTLLDRRTERAELLLDLRDCCGDLVKVGHVCGYGQCPTASAKYVGDRAGQVSIREIDAADGCT